MASALKPFSDETIRHLLQSVKRRPALYDFNPQRRLSEIKLRLRLWDEVASDVKCSVVSCKSIWQHLRITIRKEERLLKNRGGLGVSKWPWYSEMIFFLPYFYPFVTSTKNKKESDSEEVDSDFSPQTEPDGSIKNIQSSFTSNIQRYKQLTPQEIAGRRKSAPGYAAKTTLARSKFSPYKHPVARPRQQEDSGSRASQSAERATFAFPSQNAATAARQHHPSHQQPTHSNGFSSNAPSTVTSLPEAENSAPVKEKATLNHFTEYHFVSCLLEMLEEVPAHKRNIAKAKIMSEIAQAYQ